MNTKFDSLAGATQHRQSKQLNARTELRTELALALAALETLRADMVLLEKIATEAGMTEIANALKLFHAEDLRGPVGRLRFVVNLTNTSERRRPY